jgi:glyoxylase-like metal-dependent hydrolase (beta-lactamase superfamily II)
MTREVRVGGLTARVLSDGRFRLDGGAMFGIVPKPLWERSLTADARNRVSLGLNCLLVDCPDGTRVLVDTGLGDRLDDREHDQLGVERPVGGLHDELARCGLSAEDVDVVVCSHLHFDHAGGNCRIDEHGRLVPAFPNARYVVQRVEWQDAHHPHERNRGSYRRDDFEPLEAAGQLHLLDGQEEVAPGVSVARVPSHCPGLQVVWLESEGEGLVFPSDRMPTAAHVSPAWTMGYDLDVTATVLEKKELVERVLANDWIVCFDHDADVPLARLRRTETKGRPRLEAVPLPLEAE